jgi:hypothetical protein
MTTPKWAAGHVYLTGDLVQPQQVEAPTRSTLTNPGFETGVITGWTVTQAGGSGTASVATDKKFAGTYAGRWQGATGSGHSGGVEAVWENATAAAVVPGQSITALAMIALDDTSDSQNQGQVRLNWYASDGTTIIRTDNGTLIHGDTGTWKQSSVTGSAPSGAVTVRLAVWTTANSHGGVRLDSASWNHVNPPTTAGLIYKAVQPGPGTSASSEPTWPTTLGVQVVDNTVTWEAVNTNRVIWEASPILTSGATEPAWPTTPGDFVSDGTIKWECVSRRIEDENCPNTKVVAILSSKVFAVDKDIVRFSATANPLDWTSERDAGFLPTGLQQANANDMAVLAPYRGNLAAFNASSFQMWQTDPDPEAMAQLDQMEGIGSTAYKAAQPVGNDLLFLTKLGVRSVSIAAGADNLAAGDVGMPIDPLVQAAITADPTFVPLATYYPSAGQYWLTFKAAPVMTAISLTGDLPDGHVGDAVSYGYTAHGGRRPYTFTLASGALPTGLALNSDGVVTGTITKPGTFVWSVRVTDANGLTTTLADTATVPELVAHFDGAGDYIAAPFAAPIIATGDFTVEAMISFSRTALHGGIISGRNSNIRGWALQVEQNGNLTARMSMNTGLIDTTTNMIGGTVAANTLTHVAWTRAGNVQKLWVGGVQVATQTVAGSIDEPSVANLAIGTSYRAIGENSLNGYVDWVAVTIGTCRYSSTFTPPKNAASITGASVALDFDEAIGSTTFADTGSKGLTWTRTGDVVIVEYPY